MDMMIADAQWLPRFMITWLCVSQTMCIVLYSYAAPRGWVAVLRDQQSLFWMAPYIAEALWRATREVLPGCEWLARLTAKPKKPKKVIE